LLALDDGLPGAWHLLVPGTCWREAFQPGLLALDDGLPGAWSLSGAWHLLGRGGPA
jgi:hypothetical protein